MVVDHDDTVVLSLEGCLGRAGPDTGRILAVIAQEKEVSVTYPPGQKSMGSFGKCIFIGLKKKPFHLVFSLRDMGDIVDFMAGGQTGIQAMASALVHVNHHAPSPGLQGLWTG